jgi:hypothetical protein
MRRGRYSFIFTAALLGLFTMVLMGCDDSNDNDNDYPDDWYSWESLGSLGEGWGTRRAMVIDPSDNKPVVVFRDMANGGRPHVKKWSSGTTWTDLGFLTAAHGDHPSITIDPSDNKPVVVFVDNVNNAKARVMKWSSGTSWTDLGFPSTGDCRGWWRPPSITIDPSDNKPVVVFVDLDNNHVPQVKKWSSGTTWTDLGFPSTGVGEYPSITIDPSDNKPVVVFVDNNIGGRAHVMKWSSGTSWTDLGFPSTGEATLTTITIDPLDNNPIVVFVNEVVDKVQVKRWSSGTSWTDLGYPSYTTCDSPSIAIDPSDNKPVVAFQDWSPVPGTKVVHVKKWSSGTSWIGLGWPSSPEPSCDPSIAIDPSDNQPVVMYSDTFEADAKVYVAKHP